jgi:3',5'-cyclic AMP phosphodiesterase CpdA
VFRLAHVTDPHFKSLTGARPADFAGKRAIGLVNLVVNRGRKHKSELLAALREDLRGQAVDHVAVTGDLSNVSLESEWQEALRWLEALGAPPDRVTVIPGNHDAYIPAVVASRAFERLFGAFQTGDVAGVAGAEGAPAGPAYPFARLRDDVALIGVSSAVPTGDLGAWGRVGAEQLGRLEAALGHAALAGKTRVVLIHHPPVMLKGSEERNLRDRAELSAVLARAGAELVLHGHDHADERAALVGPAGVPIPVVGAGSASYAGAPDRRARYNVYEIESGGAGRGASRGVAITCVTRAHDEARGAFREVRRERLA